MELGGESLRLDESFSHQHVLADEYKVGNYYRNWPEQHLQTDGLGVLHVYKIVRLTRPSVVCLLFFILSSQPPWNRPQYRVAMVGLSPRDEGFDSDSCLFLCVGVRTAYDTAYAAQDFSFSFQPLTSWASDLESGGAWTSVFNVNTNQSAVQLTPSHICMKSP